MLTRKVRLQIAAFVVLALVGTSYAGARYAGLDRLVTPGGYEVTVRLARAGGIFENAEVTYRGVAIGRVGTPRLTDNGVAVPLEIHEGAPPIPADVHAVVSNRSAIGEQYVNLIPQSKGKPYLHDGSVIENEDTETPLPEGVLLSNLDALVSSIPNEKLRIVVDELGKAFQGTGDDLQAILDTTSEYVAQAQEYLPETRKLLEDGKTVLDTQNDQASAIKAFSENLKLISRQLKRSDADIEKILDRAPGAARQVSGLLRETGPVLTDLIRNLTSTAGVLETKTDGLELMMVTYPAIVQGGYTVAPGDGTVHFGIVLNLFNPMPCYYEDTNKRPANELGPAPLNTHAHCEVPPGSPRVVRGARNAPDKDPDNE